MKKKEGIIYFKNCCDMFVKKEAHCSFVRESVKGSNHAPNVVVIQDIATEHASKQGFLRLTVSG